jgi:phosphohistidine swiveling domain-containing protein
MNTIYVARTKEVAARMIGDEMMILSARDSKLFSLNETAAAIWQSADGVTSLANIVERCVCCDFEVDASVALRDAEELVADLAQQGVLRMSNVPIEETH